MLVAIIFAVILVVVIPVGFLMSTMGAAAAFGELLRKDAERRHGDSELLDTNY
ncbi:MAG: hypothetical protein GY724_20755 [Actinomycetia bacterium]|nr:hypothetical protein [Actinomycetes bacterium]MCP4224238.1 hypothetical protein [Actinomycetes bacterium]MCP5030840.1 hypothetical protein [Actinomycetes bacterium]